MNRHALKATDFKSVVSAYSTTRAGAVPYVLGYGREHSLYIPRALCGAPKVRILVSRGAGRSIVYRIFILFLLRELPRVKRNSSTARLLHVSAVSGVGVDPAHFTQPKR